MLTPDDVASALKVSRRTATRYMRKMQHMEKPLRITERVFEDWVWGKTVNPSNPRGIPVKAYPVKIARK